MPVTVRNQQRLHRVATASVRRLALEMAGDSDLSIVLVNDRQMQRLNRQYHATDAPTDVLSFNYGDGVGEVIVSVDHAITQSCRYGSTPGRELALYIIHGILHLRGHDDMAAGRRRQMRAAERRWLRQLEKAVDLDALLPVR